MKSEFPKKIKILDQFYNIIYVERSVDTDEEGVHSVFGQTNFHSHTVRVYKPKDYSSAEVWNTIFHESIHIIVETLKIGEIGGLESKVEENVIHLLATGINTMMIDNELCLKNIKD